MSEPLPDPSDQRESIEELQFFGTITASVSHEINNVLAMVNELSGLFEDSLLMAQQGRPLDPEQLTGVTERISAQVERGKRIVTGLNTFAHCVDNPRATLDLRENIDQITALCRRFARMRRVALVHTPSDTPTLLTGCSFTLQHALYCCIGFCLEVSGEDSQITIEFEQQARDVVILFSGGPSAGLGEVASSMQDRLVSRIDELGGTTQIHAEEGQPLTVTLRLPLSLSDSPAPSVSQEE
jgi:C4-dicarboxylate-specific signal transduction histidine kinase